MTSSRSDSPSGQTGALVGLNMVGLRRRGATRAQMHQLRRAYRSLFLVEGRLVERNRRRSRGNSPAIRWWKRSLHSSALAAGGPDAAAREAFRR